ncbi:DUF4158 domain-containing protein [Nocardia australiensis]|uniref:DUF4158 domain-containing protein n=1 Tax=Nocardia australiensis TaxID=2887191 RepID=UPI001D138E78|nr:DUF4158 domain-containing protein [Nocardia australiensis]
MRQEWSTEDLIGSWTLVGDDWQRVGNKTGATRLGFGLLLKFFEIEARFPDGPEELPAVAVAYVAEQVKVDPGLFGEYRWSEFTPPRCAELDALLVTDASLGVGSWGPGGRNPALRS